MVLCILYSQIDRLAKVVITVQKGNLKLRQVQFDLKAAGSQDFQYAIKFNLLYMSGYKIKYGHSICDNLPFGILSFIINFFRPGLT